MNDFTQQELILMACWSANRYDQVGDEQATEEGTISLSHKIQDMIVNYCEHHTRDHKGWGRVITCVKCDKDLLNE